MITANELRVGNYLTYAAQDNESYFTKIDALDIWNIERNYMYNAEIHSPIPLTEEILLKCGFENRGLCYTYYFVKSTEFIENCYIDFWLSEYSKVELVRSGICFKQIHIQYLHQLQNLYFALTNTELNIKL